MRKREKHIFYEKSLGMTVEEAVKIIEVCNQEGVVFSIELTMRFLAQHKSALKIIQEGRLGQPVYGRA